MKKVVLVISILVCMLSFNLSGCGSKPTNVPAASQTPVESEAPAEETPDEKAPAPTVDPDKPLQLKQSPFLDGKGLPPVEERLPKVPKVTNEMPPDQLNYQIGQYGGTLRTVRMEPIWDGIVWCLNSEPILNDPGRIGSATTPNVVESFEVSTDQKEFTFKLREGMKWSDGEPVTTEDVRFMIEDVLKDEEATPVFPQWLQAANKVDGTPVELEVVDEYTFKFKFDQPYGGLPMRLTTGDYQDIMRPAHYLKQFHKKYADPAELEKLVDEAGFEKGEWYNLLNSKAPSGWDSGKPEGLTYPTLYPYLHVKDGDVRIFERNPYYFKIDSEGNQLPYIDRIESTYVANQELASVKILAGEVDTSYEWAPLTKVALYKENEAQNGTKVYTNTTLHRTAADIFINLTYEDENWRKVVQDIRFRQALNLGLNKEEIVDTVYYGFAKVSDMQGTEYDPEAANKLLDEMGMVKGSDGYRIGPNGKTFNMPFVYSEWMTAYPAFAQLVTEQWKALGLNVQLKQAENSFIDTMVNANELQVNCHFSHGPVMAMYDDWGYGRWGRLWNLWYTTNGKEGEEPPADVLKFYQMVDSIKVQTLEEIQKTRQGLREEMRKHLWYLIPNEEVAQPVVNNKNLRNFDDAGFQIANSFAGEQWWFAKE